LFRRAQRGRYAPKDKMHQGISQFLNSCTLLNTLYPNDSTDDNKLPLLISLAFKSLTSWLKTSSCTTTASITMATIWDGLDWTLIRCAQRGWYAKRRCTIRESNNGKCLEGIYVTTTPMVLL